MIRKTTTLLALAALLALPATADLYYKAKTWQEGDRATDQANIQVEAWVRAGEADIRFVESANPMTPAGTRIVVKNDARDIYLVDDEKQTVSPFELDAILEMASTVLEGMGGMVKIEVNDPQVETLLEEPGGEIVGLPTTHYRFRTSYELVFKVLGMGQQQQVETFQDSWFTTAYDDPALGVWLVRDPPDLGNSELEKLFELERSKQKGFPLRTVIEESMTNKKGKTQATRTITEVTAFDESATAPSGTYGWPDHYEVVETMPTGMTGDDDEPKKGRFKRLLGGRDDG